MQPIKTTKGEILAVQVSEGASVISLNVAMDILSYSINGIPNLIDLPSDNWQLIAPLSEVTEDQAKMMVDEVKNYNNTDKSAFIDYQNSHLYTGKFWSSMLSFKSLMQANEVYGFNPFEKPQELSILVIGIEKYNENLKQFELAQERTGNWIILFNPKES